MMLLLIFFVFDLTAVYVSNDSGLCFVLPSWCSSTLGVAAFDSMSNALQ